MNNTYDDEMREHCQRRALTIDTNLIRAVADHVIATTARDDVRDLARAFRDASDEYGCRTFRVATARDAVWFDWTGSCRPEPNTINPTLGAFLLAEGEKDPVLTRELHLVDLIDEGRFLAIRGYIPSNHWIAREFARHAAGCGFAA